MPTHMNVHKQITVVVINLDLKILIPSKTTPNAMGREAEGSGENLTCKRSI